MQGEKYLNPQRIPTIWCPGCGNGIVLHAMLSAIEELDLGLQDLVFVSGIGCSSRSSTYTLFDNIHTLHGRAIPVATAIKMVHPDKKVVIMAGDGDSLAIGGNHLIHAARRNMDIMLVIFNNSIYGMTGGQVSPCTPTGKKGTTAPFGTIEDKFDTIKLLKGAGASYVARSGTFFFKPTVNYMKKALAHKGFAAVEVITPCPIYFGKMNTFKNPSQMMQWQKDHLVSKEKAENLSSEEMEDKIIIGEFVNEQRMSYIEKRDIMLKELQKS